MRKNCKNTFGWRLTRAVMDANLTQKELAAELDMGLSTVAHILTDRRKPSIKTFRKLCERLNVSADYLLGLGKNTDDKTEW